MDRMHLVANKKNSSSSSSSNDDNEVKRNFHLCEWCSHFQEISPGRMREPQPIVCFTHTHHMPQFCDRTAEERCAQRLHRPRFDIIAVSFVK